MPKTIHTESYRALIKLMRRRRDELGMSQAKLGALLGRNTKWVQRVESCEVRIDVIETLDLLRVLKIPVSTAVRLVAREEPR